MNRWRTIFKEFRSELREHSLFYGLLTGSTLGGLWANKIFWTRERADRNQERLAWELSRVQEGLDQFELLGGPEGMLEHSVCAEYCQHKKQLSRSLQDYDKWTKKSIYEQFFSIPPNRCLNHY